MRPQLPILLRLIGFAGIAGLILFRGPSWIAEHKAPVWIAAGIVLGVWLIDRGWNLMPLGASVRDLLSAVRPLMFPVLAIAVVSATFLPHYAQITFAAFACLLIPLLHRAERGVGRLGAQVAGGIMVKSFGVAMGGFVGLIMVGAVLVLIGKSSTAWNAVTAFNASGGVAAALFLLGMALACAGFVARLVSFARTRDQRISLSRSLLVTGVLCGSFNIASRIGYLPEVLHVDSHAILVLILTGLGGELLVRKESTTSVRVIRSALRHRVRGYAALLIATSCLLMSVAWGTYFANASQVRHVDADGVIRPQNSTPAPSKLGHEALVWTFLPFLVLAHDEK